MADLDFDTNPRYQKNGLPVSMKIFCNIIELLAHCKGGNFNIHIWAWFAISSAKEGKSGSNYNLTKS